ncbi:hypothetical protein CBR_g40212 [Chara braunii]|uniref:Uncharacterized protein n=1 Tax=Chara braunii TaxID=69332 RepID=A0A388LTC8_CHABU|nr:hypothetical protein CBR_g40212 [Chara braunii]|eukprot:GBG85574.1 hypothetical protein CBR_g40212 [Chara braunii]
MAKLRRGNIVWNFVTAGQYVGDQSKMHGDRKLRSNLCGHLFQGGSSKAARHFTQAKFCKAGGMRIHAELWNGTDYTFMSSTAQRVQRWMADEGIRDTRAPAGGQRQRMDDAERDEIQDALDEEEGREGEVKEGGVADEADEGVEEPDLPGEEVVMTSRGVGRAGPAPGAPRPELERARREKRTVGQAAIEVRNTDREKRARQTTIDEMYAKEKLAEFTDAWLQWIYVKGLPFNAFRGPEFQKVRQTAERVPRSIQFRFPSFRVTAGAGIPSQRAKVATMVSEVRAAFWHSGATMLSDGRKSRSGKPLMNFLVVGTNGALLYATVARDGPTRRVGEHVARGCLGTHLVGAQACISGAVGAAADPGPDGRVDTVDRTAAPGVAHSGGSPPTVRGGVGGRWSAVRRVGDRLRADYDAGRGVFTGRTPVQTQAAEGGSGRPSLQMAGRMLGLSRAETRRSLVLEAVRTSTDMLRGEQFTSGEEGLLMRAGTRRQHGLSEVEARLAAGIAAGQAALDVIQREREMGIAARAAEDEDADTESKPIETAACRHRAQVAAAATAAQAAYLSRARGTSAGGRGGRRGGPHGRSSSGRGRARSGG